MEKNNSNNPAGRVSRMVVLAMLCALAYIVMFFGRIPLGFADFLKYDPKDVILTIAAFMYGPISGLISITVVGLLEMVTVSNTGIIGLIMNIISSGAFACVAGLIYKYIKNVKGIVLGVILGTLSMTFMMLLWNYIMTPIYMEVPREAVVAMLPTVFLPFNLIKGGLNALFTVIIFIPLRYALTKSKVIK